MKCRFCGSSKINLVYPSNKDVNDKKASHFACTNSEFGKHGDILRCGKCKVVYLDEDVSQEKITTYYEIVEDPTYFIEQPARVVTFKNYLKRLESIYPKKGKLVDIGTHTGLFVKIARDSGWDATGIEPNKWSVDFAKKNYGVNLINKAFTSGLFKDNTFDVVTMWDVIEHFTDPVAEVKKVYRYLKPGGVFAFSTVDPSSLLARLMGTKWSWYMEMHRVFFDRQTAEYYLKQTGFKDIVFDPHWRSLSLGYLSTRLAAINPLLAKISGGIISKLGLSRTIVPYYANDLYNCYATK